MTQQDSSPREGPYAMWVILAGLGAMTAVTVGALIRYADPTAIVTALGPVVGVIGTLVGAYFGMRGSSLAQQHAAQAEMARAAMQTSPPPDDGRTEASMIVRPSAPSQNGSGAAGEVNQQLAAIDTPSDPDDADIDLPDPEDVPLDPEPTDEGDDREAHGATR